MISKTFANNSLNLTEEWPIESKMYLESLGDRLKDKRAVVTGGASFIGSHLVEALLDSGCQVLVLDDLSSGLEKYLPLEHPKLKFKHCNILEDSILEEYLEEVNFIFHLAAIHGGRGFIESQQQAILQNIRIDNQVFEAATKMEVGRIVYASSACAYPINQQDSQTKLNFLVENKAGKIIENMANPDGVYGWTKLLGELQLETYVSDAKTTAVAARIFTAYGPRENESHAAIALIAKALLNMNPLDIWGNGMQTRNFTYVTDTVCGLIGAALYNTSLKFDILNIGTSQHYTVLNFVQKIYESLNQKLPEFNFQLEKPAGVASRASNNEKIMDVLNWMPQIGLEVGIKRTIAWYLEKEDRPKSLDELKQILESR
jgi:nucleoside-diphosphate-sugar epimerase